MHFPYYLKRLIGLSLLCFFKIEYQTHRLKLLKSLIMSAMEKAMATHSSFLAWRIPGMGESGGLPSMGSGRTVSDTTEAT